MTLTRPEEEATLYAKVANLWTYCIFSQILHVFSLMKAFVMETLRYMGQAGIGSAKNSKTCIEMAGYIIPPGVSQLKQYLILNKIILTIFNGTPDATSTIIHITGGHPSERRLHDER